MNTLNQEDKGNSYMISPPQPLTPAIACGPGEVPVKVDDLDLGYWAEEEEDDWESPGSHVAIRAAKAKAVYLNPPATDRADDEWKVGDRVRDHYGKGSQDDDVRLVDVPWADGTVRKMPVGSVVARSNRLVYVDEGGYQFYGIDVGDGNPYDWDQMYVDTAFAPVDPPPVKVSLPTNDGAVIRVGSAGVFSLIGGLWRGASSGSSYGDAALSLWESEGFEVLFDGVSA